MAGHDSYRAMFTRFFNSSKMSSTYKPVFLKALLDVGDLDDPSKAGKIVGRKWLREEDGKLFVKLDFVAVRFAKYYWDMEHTFKLKQSHSPDDANVLKIIRGALDHHKKPPTVAALANDRMAGFRTDVIQRSIRPQVLKRLPNDMPSLYKKENANEISLGAEIVEYAHQHKAMLTHGLNYVIAKYLEKINRGTPNIAKKVSHHLGPIHRPQLCRKSVGDMRGWQDSRCFYCGRKYEAHHVDHVIPFNFVFSTDLYNCVLACQRCNCKKSDILPDKDRFGEVLERNLEKRDYMAKRRIAYSNESYNLLFETCVVEYNGHKFFKPD